MAYNRNKRDFNSIEMALSKITELLSESEIKQASSHGSNYLRKCSDPNEERHVQHRHSINLDLQCLRKGHGHPLLSAHQAIIENAIKTENMKPDLNQSLLSIVDKLGSLTRTSTAALDPSSPGGVSISTNEKEEIYKSIRDLEAKIAELKKAVEV